MGLGDGVVKFLGIGRSLENIVRVLREEPFHALKPL